jgi:hypothetical protein
MLKGDKTMTALMQKFDFLITTQQNEAKRSGHPMMGDSRPAYEQLVDLLTIARQLQMYKAVAWLQPQVLKMAEKT